MLMVLVLCVTVGVSAPAATAVKAPFAFVRGGPS